jgi:hypothetical protein
MWPTGRPEISVTTNLRCVTSQKSDDLFTPRRKLEIPHTSFCCLGGTYDRTFEQTYPLTDGEKVPGNKWTPPRFRILHKKAENQVSRKMSGCMVQNDSTKSPVSGIATVSQPKLMSQVGRVRAVVCFWNWRREGASILAVALVLEWPVGSQHQYRMPPGHSRDIRWSVRSALCSRGRWVAEVDTWPLIHGRCYHVTAVGGPYSLWDSRWRLSFKIKRYLWNYSIYTNIFFSGM